jgi:hypothetical protein
MAEGGHAFAERHLTRDACLRRWRDLAAALP